MTSLFPQQLIVCFLLSFAAAAFGAQDWKPAAGPLMTKWAKDVKPSKVLPEYPRPQNGAPAESQHDLTLYGTTRTR